jgi:hypothetical protein
MECFVIEHVTGHRSVPHVYNSTNAHEFLLISRHSHPPLPTVHQGVRNATPQGFYQSYLVQSKDEIMRRINEKIQIMWSVGFESF